MQIELQNKQAFEEILATYLPSEHAKSLLGGIPLVILQGISGSGRNTIIDHLVANNNFHQIISDTTRPPKLRNGAMEQDGVQYFFRSEDDILTDLKNGMFLEAELIHNQQVSGISIRELIKAAESQKVPINEVAREGVNNIRQAKSNTVFFFIVPPSYDEWLARLKNREVMSDEELSNRKKSAILEIKEALEAPDFIFALNDSVERVSDIINNTVKNGINATEDRSARVVAQDILAKLTN